MSEESKLKSFLQSFFRPKPGSKPAPIPLAQPISHTQPAKSAPEAAPKPKRNFSPPPGGGRKGGLTEIGRKKDLLAAIRARGEFKPGEVARELGLARSSMAYHMNRLVAEGVLERLGHGGHIRYRLKPKPQQQPDRPVPPSEG